MKYTERERELQEATEKVLPVAVQAGVKTEELQNVLVCLAERWRDRCYTPSTAAQRGNSLRSILAKM